MVSSPKLVELGPLHGSRSLGVFLDVPARGEGRPQRAEERPSVGVVEGAKHRLDGLGGLLSLVKRNTAAVTVSGLPTNSDRFALTGTGGVPRGCRQCRGTGAFQPSRNHGRSCPAHP